MNKNWEYYTYEAMNILIRPNAKDATKELAERMGISLEDAIKVVQKYKLYDSQDAISLGENKELFNEDKQTDAYYGKVRVINYVATEIQMKENSISEKEIQQEKTQ